VTPYPEAVHAAEFLAEHALVLLGLGVILVVAAAACVAGAVHLASRYRERARLALLSLAARAGEVPGLGPASARARALLRRYLTLQLLASLAVVGASLLFLDMAEEIGRGEELAAFDLAFANALREEITPAWHRFFSIVSLLGTRYALASATFVIALAFLAQGRPVLAAAWAAAQAGGGLLNLLLKGMVERARPETSGLLVSGWSFPSGHAMGTFVFCGVAAYIILRHRPSRLAAYSVVVAAVVWSVTMSFSRLYLGVHYASDVVAGLIAGGAWVAGCIPILDLALRRYETSPR
jgi:undecaprenyl-diphosphatase